MGHPLLCVRCMPMYGVYTGVLHMFLRPDHYAPTAIGAAMLHLPAGDHVQAAAVLASCSCFCCSVGLYLRPLGTASELSLMFLLAGTGGSPHACRAAGVCMQVWRSVPSVSAESA